jgi:hypothetical protein
MLATTRGALHRGSAPDALGDEVDDNATPVEGYEDFPLSLIERDRAEYDPATNTMRVVRELVARVPSSVPVDEGDRIRDLRDSALYAVDGFRRTPRGISGRSSVTMTVRRTTP